jgi:uncharacterized repeat protein (TIGR04052 family)
MTYWAKLMVLATLVCVPAAVAIAQGARSNSKAEPVHIRFEGRLAGKPFACGRLYEGVGTGASTVTPADLRFFVSEIEMIDAQGGTTPVALDQDGLWQYKSLALIDLEDGTGECRNGNAATHAEVTGSVPPGRYTGVRFTVGVPFALDHLDPAEAPSPLNMTAMFWTWQSGYKFIRAEVLVAPSRAPATTPEIADGNSQNPAERARARGFPVHIGSTGCGGTIRTNAPPEECAHPNRAVVTLQDFDSGRDVVIFDLSRLLEGSDVTTNAPNTAPGCMSGEDDPDCVAVKKALGIASQGAPATRQTVFYGERK